MNTFADVVDFILGFVNILIPLLFGLIFLLVIWRIIDAWIIHGGDAAKVKEGKTSLLVGVFALVVLSGVWGIVALLQNSLFSI